MPRIGKMMMGLLAPAPTVLAIVVLLILALPRALTGQAMGEVWVNTNSQRYHCPGTRYFGKTTRGYFTTEAKAREAGVKAAGGRACDGDLAASTPSNPAERPDLQVDARGSDGPPSPIGKQVECRVERIVDGDTLRCRGRGPVRLIGIDTPEMREGAIARQARNALARLAPPGAALVLEFDVQSRDRYGRELAYLWREGIMLNWTLVRSGYARVATYPPNVRYVDHLLGAQRAAQREGRGLW